MASSSRRQAWVVAAVTFGVLFVSAGVRTAPSVFLTPFQAEFGWSRAGISLAVATGFVMFGLGGPFVGSLIGRLGPRRVMLGGIALVATGLAPMLALRSLWQLQLLWGLLVGTGTGMLGSVLGAAIAVQWFPTQRGLVVGLLGTASSFGQLLFLPALLGLTARAGWRSALIGLAAACLVAVVAVLVLVRDQKGAAGAPAGESEPAVRLPLRAVLATPEFWLLAGSFFLCGYTSDGLVGTHLVPHALEHGFGEAGTAATMSLISVANVTGTLIAGWLTDRVENRRLLATFYGLRGLALLALPFAGGLAGLVVVALLLGLDWSATVPPTVNLITSRFGKDSVGLVYGWIFCAHMVGAALASYAGGLLRDLLGSYTVAFLSAGVLGLVAMLLVTRVASARETVAGYR